MSRKWFNRHKINCKYSIEESSKCALSTRNLPCSMNLAELQTLPSSPKSALFDHYVILKFPLFATRFNLVVIYKTF